MPSTNPLVTRRGALGALGSAATLSLAGCLGVTHADSAYCQLKLVDVTWSYQNRAHRDDVCRAMGHPDVEGKRGEVRTRVAEEFSGIAGGPRDVAVDDEMADRLDRTFESVGYALGFCGDAFDGCRNTRAASRADFNAVQVGDEARVTLLDDALHVHSVDAATDTGGWETEFDRFDFSELHADDGVPLDD